MDTCFTSPVRTRVLIIAPEPIYEDRGTPIAVTYVLEALSELGYEVDLLTYPLGYDIELPGLRIFRLRNTFRIRHVPIGFSFKKLLLDTFLIQAMLRRLKKGDYELIHAVEESAFAAVTFKWLHNVPVIYDMQSDLPEQLKKYKVLRNSVIQKILKRIEHWVIRKADVVACSAGLQDLVRIIDPGVRVWAWQFPHLRLNFKPEEVQRFRKKLNILPESKIVLYTGNFEQYQGISLLMEAIPQVVSNVPETIFILVGIIDSDNLSFSGMNAKLQEQGVLKIYERQPRGMIPLFLAMADVLVSPREDSGNIPLKIFDYMATGKPIVATDNLTHRAVLNDDMALLVEPSAEKFAKAIKQLLQNEKQAKRLGAAAKAFVEKNLAWQDFLESVSRVYSSAQQVARKISV